MDFGLADDPAQATRIKNCDVSSPDVTAYCALRISHWTFTPHMDSDHCLISHLVGMDDGIPRLANTPPRQKKTTFALRKADWPAFTSCETLLATASTWLGIRGGKLRAAECHILRGSRETPKRCGHTKWSKPRSPQKLHTTHTLPRSETACLQPNLLEKEGTKIRPYAVASLCLWKPARKKLGASPSPGWRYLRGVAAPHPHPLESVVLRADIGRVCALPRQRANLLVRHFVRFSRATLPYTAAAARRTPLLPCGWEMDRPLTPYVIDVAIRDSSLGSAPGHDNMLNEFLHRLGPVACGTLLER
ncbi:hypothetical protein ECC02_007403 [Trypanosoma cruzi]|uniref:Uncharacterized protein n=1 Tax=Trypanosoma cruzi TaxID=5693 RepID=A0A7J6XYS3_TRYCR|nr:hypothetical protein ECC02_007403 [Trypanosoma cruzi]